MIKLYTVLFFVSGQTYKIYIYTHTNTHSQVHKYWDIDTILIFLAPYTTTMDLKRNEQDVLYVQTFSFILRVFTSKSGERCRNYNGFYMCLPLFKGPKVMGQTNNHKSNVHFLIPVAMTLFTQPPSSSSLFHISSVHHGGCSGHIRVNICTPLPYGYALCCVSLDNVDVCHIPIMSCNTESWQWQSINYFNALFDFVFDSLCV